MPCQKAKAHHSLTKGMYSDALSKGKSPPLLDKRNVQTLGKRETICTAVFFPGKMLPLIKWKFCTVRLVVAKPLTKGKPINSHLPLTKGKSCTVRLIVAKPLTKGTPMTNHWFFSAAKWQLCTVRLIATKPLTKGILTSNPCFFLNMPLSKWPTAVVISSITDKKMQLGNRDGKQLVKCFCFGGAW